jgi:DNA-directed RNA polymerase delta subunit
VDDKSLKEIDSQITQLGFQRRKLVALRDGNRHWALRAQAEIDKIDQQVAALDEKLDVHGWLKTNKIPMHGEERK